MSFLSSSCFLCGDEVPTSSSARSCTTDKNGCRSVAEKEKAEVAIILSGILFSEDNFEPCREVLNAASYCGRCESRLKLVKTQFQVIERLRNQMAESLGKIVQSMVEHCEKILEDGPILPVIVHHKHELYESLDFMLEDVGITDGFETEFIEKTRMSLLPRLNDLMELPVFSDDEEEVERSEVSSATSASASGGQQITPNGPKHFDGIEEVESSEVSSTSLGGGDKVVSNDSMVSDDNIRKDNEDEELSEEDYEAKVINGRFEQMHVKTVDGNEMEKNQTEKEADININNVSDKTWISYSAKAETSNSGGSSGRQRRRRSRWTCTKCHVICRGQQALSDHVRHCHNAHRAGSKPMKCSVRSKTKQPIYIVFNTMPNFNPQQKKYQCKFCRRYESNSDELAKHVKLNHRKRQTCYSTNKRLLDRDEERENGTSTSCNEGNLLKESCPANDKKETLQNFSDSNETGSGPSTAWKCRTCL